MVGSLLFHEVGIQDSLLFQNVVFSSIKVFCVSIDRTQEKHRFINPRKPKRQSQGKSPTSTSMPPMTYKQTEGKKPM